ncbi:MAG: hypothetical protein BWK80_24710 [Desulfobacteraceae bacterium IS3]|nr:MAG: hypothetical protein BWK80_24710 [Desulfobacteraceae bacterium IS3]
MDCLSSERIILFHEKSLKKFGGLEGVYKPEDVLNLQASIKSVSPNYDFDEIEMICLAVYRIAKGHFFVDGNKRTANYVLLNYLKLFGYKYTGRPIDLARKIEEMAQTMPTQKEKENAVGNLAYFLKSKLQKN